MNNRICRIRKRERFFYWKNKAYEKFTVIKILHNFLSKISKLCPDDDRFN